MKLQRRSLPVTVYSMPVTWEEVPIERSKELHHACSRNPTAQDQPDDCPLIPATDLTLNVFLLV